MNTIKLYCFIFFISLLTGCVGLPTTTASNAPKTQPYWPSHDWRISQPEAQGMDSEMLARMFQQIEDQQLNLHGLLIVRNGYLVTEAYFHPYTQNQPQYVASVTKSVISTLVGIAIQRGDIQNTDQKLASFFPDQPIANLDERKEAITLKNLLTLTAGFACDDSPITNGARMEQSSNFVQFMLDAPMAAQPGTRFNYCGGAVHLLSAILQKTTGMNPRDFANQFLFEPLDIPAVPENRWQTDPQGLSIGGYGLYLTPRDMAKFGYLFLQNGQWQGNQILSEDWVKTATTRYTTKDNGLGYGYLWTIDPDQGSYSALGYAGQEIYVIPSRNLVIVFTGALPSYENDMDFVPLKALVDSYILPAVKSDQELPPNSAGAAKLDAFIGKAADPEQPVPPLPAGAQQWSGLVYQMEPNPNQWETISFEVKPGADTMTVTLNGQVVDPPIGLDHRFRVQEQADVYAPIAMRGEWKNGNTLLVKFIPLGEVMGTAGEIELQFVFSAEEITMNGRYVVNGQEFEYHGKRFETGDNTE